VTCLPTFNLIHQYRAAAIIGLLLPWTKKLGLAILVSNTWAWVNLVLHITSLVSLWSVCSMFYKNLYLDLFSFLYSSLLLVISLPTIESDASSTQTKRSYTFLFFVSSLSTASIPCSAACSHSTLGLLEMVSHSICPNLMLFFSPLVNDAVTYASFACQRLSHWSRVVQFCYFSRSHNQQLYLSPL
jgi:hypothetical protein